MGFKPSNILWNTEQEALENQRDTDRTWWNVEKYLTQKIQNIVLRISQVVLNLHYTPIYSPSLALLYYKYANKVDTTYRCEALKEVMSFKCVKSQILKYIFTKHLHTKDPKYFRYFKMIYISKTFDIIDIIDYFINRIVKLYNDYLPM